MTKLGSRSKTVSCTSQHELPLYSSCPMGLELFPYLMIRLTFANFSFLGTVSLGAVIKEADPVKKIIKNVIGTVIFLVQTFWTDFLGARAPLELAILVTVRHEKVSKLQDLVRTSYIRYLPTIICKVLLVLLSPPVCVGVHPRFCFT